MTSAQRIAMLILVSTSKISLEDNDIQCIRSNGGRLHEDPVITKPAAIIIQAKANYGGNPKKESRRFGM